MRYNYQNELDKACFQYDMAYGDFKALTTTTSDKILHDKAFNIAKNPKYDGYQHKLAPNFLIKIVPVVVLKMRIFQTKNLLKNYTSQPLKNLIKKTTLTF